MHNSAPQAFWAKLDRTPDGRVLGWLSIVDHSADVAACFEVLLDRTLLGPRLARLGGLEVLSPQQVARLCVWAALHDVGKFNLGFQNKALARPPFTAGHLAEVAAWLSADGQLADRFWAAFPAEHLNDWCADDSTTSYLFAMLAHHGRPLARKQACGHQIWQPTPEKDPFAGIAELTANIRQWFPLAFEPGGDLLPAAPAFQHGFAGLLQLADWLGSDSKRFFPFAKPEDGDRMALARHRAAFAIAAIGLDPAPARRGLGPTAPGFEAILPDRSPRPMQEHLRSLPMAASGSLTILESETGSGKTEAVLARYLRLFHAGLVDGLFFALPTRTAATQIQRRVEVAVARAWPHPTDRPPVVLAVPGYYRVDQHEGQALPGFEVLWNDHQEDELRNRGWAAERPKRYCAGAVVVGTIDQALFSALQVPHAHLRATALLRHLLVVDEVHASDAYMVRLLEAVLEQHVFAGGHALLLSATLGAAARQRLVAVATAGTSAPPPLEQARQVPYPAITTVEDRQATLHAVADAGNPKRVVVELAPVLEDPAAIAALALSAARAGARVLVVRNVVSACIATQQALETLAMAAGENELLFRPNFLLGEGGGASGPVAAPHHARFAAADRRLLDRAVEVGFGKDRTGAAGLVLIATQTVEQSLDLDADLLITDLCPADVLLQRIGRLHRHSPTRPRGFEAARVVVATPAERDLGRFILTDRRAKGEARGPCGLGTVYQDLRVLEATWRALERRAELTIPAMNRELVEAATHPQALAALVEELGEPWAGHGENRTGVACAEKTVAALNLLQRQLSFLEPGVPYPPKDLAREIRTRLGADDRVAKLGRGIDGPFGAAIDELTIPAFLAEGIPADARVTIEAEGQGRIELSFGERRYRYDRLGLRQRREGDENE